MSAPMVSWQRKIQKNKLKTLLCSPPKKQKLNENVNDSKSHIWNSFSANIILGIQRFYIRPHVAVYIIRIVFKNFGFSSRKSQTQQELAKKITNL